MFHKYADNSETSAMNHRAGLAEWSKALVGVSRPITEWCYVGSNPAPGENYFVFSFTQPALGYANIILMTHLYAE